MDLGKDDDHYGGDDDDGESDDGNGNDYDIYRVYFLQVLGVRIF